MRTALAILFLPLLASAGTANMMFTPPPDTNVVFRIYAGTNSPLTTTNAVGWKDIGTNTTATVTVDYPGRWYFIATALSPTAESKPSNECVVHVPASPSNFGNLTVEASVNLTNWIEVYRVKITTP